MDYLALQVVHYALTTQRLDRYYCQSRTGKAVERLSGNFQVAYVSISFERALPFDGHGSGVCERHRELHGSVLAEIIYFGPSESEDLASVYFLVRLKFAWDQVRLAEDTDSTSVYDTDIDVRSVSTEHIFLSRCMLVPRRCELRLLSPAEHPRGVQTPRLNIGDCERPQGYESTRDCERPQGYESTLTLSEQSFGVKTVEEISVPQARIA